jgi:MYXO-CTERM domain-containing protein
MKRIIFSIAILGAILSQSVWADVLYSWSGSQTIPDYDASVGASGVSFTFDPSTVETGPIPGASVTFTITGGYNGDLYSYLSSSSGAYVVLLNRPGVGTGTPGSTTYTYGFSGAGFNNVTLSDSGSPNINTTAETPGVQVPSGNYAPAGTGGTAFSSFNNINSGDTWTLYFSDMDAGGTSTITSLEVDSVPEPGTWGAISGAGLLGLCGVRAWRQRRQQNAAV